MNKRILYIEDMRNCYDSTKDTFDGVRICWIKKITPKFDRIIGHLKKYDSILVDVNLNESKPDTKEGLEIIKKLKKFSEYIPIVCVSSWDYREESKQAGADLFMFKLQLWVKGKSELEKLLDKDGG